jgi:hypothetical protein
MIVSRVERRVRLDELHRGSNRLADRSRFCTQVVFEAAHQPETRLLLKHH